MHCNNCERIIAKRIKSIEGVESVKVSYETETGEVTFDPEKMNIDSILKPVEEDSYICSLIEDEMPKEDSGEQPEEPKISDASRLSKTELWKLVSAILAILLVSSIITGGFGFGTGSQNTNPSQIQPNNDVPTKNTQIDMVKLADDDTVKGDSKAKVTIVEWSDFECPFCERFYSGAYQNIKKDYIDTGKVKFVYRDFPLPFHKNAQKAAEAAECAKEQGKFWEMHDKLFEEGVSGGLDSFKQFAKDIGLDSAKFNECLDSGKTASEIKKDMGDGQNVGISGTPGFIINGQLISGAQPFESFKQIIDAELAK